MSAAALAGAIALGLIVGAAGVLCLWTAWRYDRPRPTPARALEVAAWWTGQALWWAALLLLAGGRVGAGARAAWYALGRA